MGDLIQVRKVPEHAHRTLRARAAARGQSLNDFTLGVIDAEVSSPDVADVLDRAQRRTERAAVSSVGFIRGDRDRQAQPPA